MFELARRYRDAGMLAYSQLQEKEFLSEREHGYQAVKHQASSAPATSIRYSK
jgi:isocitrate/methylisocitrate lyase